MLTLLSMEKLIVECNLMSVYNEKLIFLFLNQTYVVGTPKTVSKRWFF